MIFALDIDGVTSNVTREMLYRVNAYGVDATDEDITTFKFEECLPVPKDFIVEQFQDQTFWLNQIPFEDAWTCINKWFSDGHDIFFITARHEDARESTYRWFEMWDIPFNDVLFGNEHMGKHEVITELGAKFFVEDRITEATEIARQGIMSFLMDRTYNKGETPAVRVKSMYDIDDMITNGTIR
jgi:uncharacterized HAD superfamily protein